MAVLTFDTFKRQWLKEIEATSISPTVKAYQFARKLFAQWKDLPVTVDDLVEWPSPVESGIDYIYSEEFEEEKDNQASTVWYLIQSKYGTRSSDATSILSDGEKVVRNISQFKYSNDDAIMSKFGRFLQPNKSESSPSSRLILVIATEDTLTPTERSQLDNIRTIGKNTLGVAFDVEAISLETIFANVVDDSISFLLKTKITMEGNLTSSGQNILVGSVSLPSLYSFLKAYRGQTGDLDQLYEKNVRRFLGTRRRINKQMRETLINDPAQFGLYNNGITLVVKDFEPQKQGYVLHEPYIVNGCQTTRTIWDIFSQRYESAKPENPSLAQWRASAESGIVVVKVVRVGSSGEELLAKITRFTNSQNAVSEKDFITLDKGFQTFKQQMAAKYKVFLEIQRGGWDSQVAFQSQDPKSEQFVEHANAFDLLKVYGAGWLREVGTAFGRNLAFVPGGRIYKNIIEDENNNFNIDELFAAYNIEKAADQSDFGRGAKKATRRLTRYLFYLVTIDLLRDVMVRNNVPVTNKSITIAINKLVVVQEAFSSLIESAIAVVDEYMTQGEEDSIFNEPVFIDEFNKDVNAYLKWNKLGQPEFSPKLHALLAINKRTMGRGQPSPRDLIAQRIK